MQTNHTRKHDLERGQSLVEMALGFTLFLIVVLGLLDLGRLFFIYIAMEDSASEAALYLALNADCPLACDDPDAPGTSACTEDATACNAPNNAMYRAQKASSIIDDAINWAETDLDYQFIAATADTEAMVEVTIEYPFGLITPIISDIVGDDTFVLQASATHVRIAD